MTAGSLGLRAPRLSAVEGVRVPTIEDVTIRRMEHVGIVVDDLADAVAFFATLGLELEAEVPVEGDWVDRIVGLEGVRAQIAILRTPDGHGRLAYAPPAQSSSASWGVTRTATDSATSVRPISWLCRHALSSVDGRWGLVILGSA
jgi:hypothetical protein